MNEDKELQELIVCDCADPEHQIIFRGDRSDGVSWVFMTVHLCKLPFFKRLWHGLKYIFGYRCKYGDFDELVLSSKHIKALENVVNYLKFEEK